MLKNLSEQIRNCLQHAEECGQRAKIECDPALARDFLEMERRWLALARSYQFGESLDDFIAASPKPVTAGKEGHQGAFEHEATWLRPRVIQMRALLRQVKNARVEAVLREFIADAEARLETLEDDMGNQRTARASRSRLPPSH